MLILLSKLFIVNSTTKIETSKQKMPRKPLVNKVVEKLAVRISNFSRHVLTCTAYEENIVCVFVWKLQRMMYIYICDYPGTNNLAEKNRLMVSENSFFVFFSTLFHCCGIGRACYSNAIQRTQF